MSAVDEIKDMEERVFDERKSESIGRGRTVGVDIKRDPELLLQILPFHLAWRSGDTYLRVVLVQWGCC